MSASTFFTIGSVVLMAGAFIFCVACTVADKVRRASDFRDRLGSDLTDAARTLNESEEQ